MRRSREMRAQAVHVTSLACRGGPATIYEVSVQAEHRKTYRFFQPIQENRVNPAADDVELWVEPGDIEEARPRQAFRDINL